MHFLYFAALAGLANGATINHKRSDAPACTNPSTRTEWRELAPEVQKNYVESVLCLKTKPSRIGLNTTLYDDFPYIHQKFNKIIHGLADFLPWHRYFTQVYESAVRDCGYKGAIPYWDWTLDVLKFSESPVMSDTGFGYTGTDNRTEIIHAGIYMNYTVKCVPSGPFSNLRLEYFGISPKDYLTQDHCLSRDIAKDGSPDSIYTANECNATTISRVQSDQPFGVYRMSLENGPHAAIHNAVAGSTGDMGPQTSPNEPLFFLHHAQIDRLWWKWQQENPSERQFDYSGPTISPTTNQLINATLDDMLVMGGLATDLSVRDVMSTNDRLCYNYAK